MKKRIWEDADARNITVAAVLTLLVAMMVGVSGSSHKPAGNQGAVVVNSAPAER